MANIDHYLEDIEVASRGEEVRDSIIDAFEALNSEGPGTMAWNNITGTPDTLTGYGVSEVPASMVSGVLALNNIPPSALERVVPVADDTARFALTSSDVQNGDTVKVLSTMKLYLVVDDTSLSTEAGYEEYKAGTADSVDWSGVLNTPDTLAGYGIEDAYTKDEVDDIVTSEEVESETGNPIVIETDAAQYAKNTHLALAPVQDLHGYDHPWAGGAGKNKFNTTGTTTTNNGKTFTVQSDGSISITGTAGENRAYMQAGQQTLDAGTYILSSGSTSNNYFIDFTFSVSGNQRVKTSELSITISQTETVTAWLSAEPSSTPNNVMIYPMIRTSGDSTWEPYSNICPITLMGHRNLLPMTVEGIKAANTAGVWSGNAYTYRGITYTVYADAEGNVTSIKVVGTSTASSMMYLSSATSSSSHISFDGKQPFIISGGAANVRAMVWLYDSNNAFVINVNSTGLDAYINADQGYTYYCPLLEISSGVTVDATVYPMLRLASDLDSTFVPYGMARVGAKATGKNLIPLPTLRGYWAGANGDFVSDNTWVACEKTTVKPNTEYHISCTKQTRWLGITAYDENGVYIGGIGETSSSALHTPNYTFTTPSDCYFIGVTLAWTYGVAVLPSEYDDLQLELGSTATDYEPYKDYTASLDLPEPVYSGTLDLETGEVVVDMGSVTLGNLDWSVSTPSNHAFRSDSLRGIIKPAPSNADVGNAICDSFFVMAYTPLSANDNGAFSITGIADSNSGRVIFVDHRYSTIEDFVTGNLDTRFVYELATPKTYQLTPQQLALFKGINNIFANAKTVQVTYRNGEFATTGDIVASTEVAKKNILGEAASDTDTKLATSLAPILGNFATAETSPTSASHAVGEYLLYNNRLYKVLAAISAGQQLTIGTNIEQTSVAAELARLNSLLT